ncbi:MULTISPECIES: hypothetical protein [Bradyrhizobium]|uniref:hypothetical protein n=1 Tax=Bradyrhizobium TaxID=374 RepID=UPI000231CB66|nr:hypothetical protein [Bradyrhizobium japonicum]AJA61040.1 hypothetical protein RN69_12170 [Bradyrhizobium japonicum]KMJ99693.1 hypothetical protein CF64_10990 [Bradyrhizobium japonicum]MCS3533932.1 hypothetical protein [Bradyrhizobium japonicum]MCS3989974.1 hypothetical protein [Bradyrhizobium japonicum]MCS4015213.1 hypothetical protein [Bradyrhizobium japonicum]
MATDKSIRKGDYLRGGFHPASMRAADTLRAEFPLLEGVLQSAGPPPTPERLAELATERLALEARMAELKRRIAELCAAEKRK